MPLKEFAFKEEVGDSEAESRPKPYNILYVEDDDGNWDTSCIMLRRTCELTRAKTSEEAFAALKSATFDAILMDIGLARSPLNGIEITEVLRGKRQAPQAASALVPLRLPIIFVTAFAAEYDRLHLIAAGGDEVLTKPVDFLKLFVTLIRVMREEHRRVVG